jgi:hypothetical protein
MNWSPMPLYCRVNPKGEGITNIRKDVWGKSQAQAQFQEWSHLHAFCGVKIDATLRARPFM